LDLTFSTFGSSDFFSILYREGLLLTSVSTPILKKKGGVLFPFNPTLVLHGQLFTAVVELKLPFLGTIFLSLLCINHFFERRLPFWGIKRHSVCGAPLGVRYSTDHPSAAYQKYLSGGGNQLFHNFQNRGVSWGHFFQHLLPWVRQAVFFLRRFPGEFFPPQLFNLRL